jgi:branched-chain amino acid transport system substrate-binding protein
MIGSLRKPFYLSSGICSIIALSLVVAGCGSSSSSASGSSGGTTIKVGEMAHLSGPSAGPYGIPFDHGLRLGIDDVNSSNALGNVKLKLDSHDVAGAVPAAVTQFNKFVQAGTTIIVSPNVTPIALAITPLAQQEKVFFLSGATVSDAVDHTFGLVDARSPEITFGKRVVALGHKRIAVILDGDNPAFTTITNNFEQGLKESGGSIAQRATIREKDSDFSSVISKVRQVNPDLVVFATLSDTAGNIMTQMKQAGGFDKVQMGGTVAWQQQVYTTAGSVAAGSIFPSYWIPGGTDSVGFVAKYQKTYNSEPKTYDALGYQAAWLIASAVQLANQRGQKVTGEVISTLITEAVGSALMKEHGPIADFQEPASGFPQYPGVVATFNSSGKIVPLTG